MTMQHAIQRHPVENDDARRKALESTYPGWDITHHASTGVWSARRRAAITDAQADAGVVSAFFRDSYEGFVAELADQAARVDQCGYHPPPHSQDTS